MRTSKSIKKTFKTILKVVLAFYILALFYAFHVYKVYDGNILNSLNVAFEHIKNSPFDIFPLSLQPVKITSYLLMLAIMLLYIEYQRKKQLRPGVEHGSADWNSDLKIYNKTFSYPKGKPYSDERVGKSYAEVKSLKDWKPNKNMILNNEVFLNMDTRATLRNNNILAVGGSGSGKTRFLGKPNILQANCSYVITDPSGEILETMGSFLKKQGYEVKVFNLVQMEHSYSYNPFAYIRNEEGVLTMINALIANTTPPNAVQGDPFWEKAETALLQALCFYLYYECNMEDRNFTNVMKLLRCAEVREGQEDFDSTLDIMFKDLAKRDAEHIAVRQYAVFKQAAGKTAQSILVSCSVRLTVFNMKAITNLTSIDNIELSTIGDKPTALFCITPVVDKTFNFLVALLYTQLFESLYFHAETQCKGKRLPVHVRFILDEFANIGTIPDFEQKLATMRKYEISCTIIIQNLAQLKKMYKDSWESITGNCDTFLFLGGQEQSTLKYVSEQLGKETIKAQNSSRNFGRQGSSGLSYNTTGRELMTADEIARMSTMECILIIRGLQPFKGNKYDYTRHPNYKFTGDANDDFLYDVKENVYTEDASAFLLGITDEESAILYDDVDRDDTLNSEREYRREQIRSLTASGKELYVPVPASELDITEDDVNDLTTYDPFGEYEEPEEFISEF